MRRSATTASRAPATQPPRGTSQSSREAPAVEPGRSAADIIQGEIDLALAVNDLDNRAENITAGEGDTSAQTVDATEFIASRVDYLGPDLSRRLIEEANGSIGTVAGHLDGLDRDQSEAAVGYLTVAGERLGQDDIGLLTDIVAEQVQSHFTVKDHFDHTDAYDGSGDNHFLEAIQHSIEDGKGALFGAGLTESLYNQGAETVASAVASKTDAGIATVVANYEEALVEHNGTESALSGFTVNAAELAGDDLEALEAGRQAILAGRAEEELGYLAAQRDYASVLEGASYGSRKWLDNEDMVVGRVHAGEDHLMVMAETDILDRDSWTAENPIDFDPDSARAARHGAVGRLRDAFEYMPSLMQEAYLSSPSGVMEPGSYGSDVIANALFGEANGETTFLGTAQFLAEQGRFEDAHSERYGEASPHTWADQFDTAVLYGGSRAQELLFMGAGVDASTLADSSSLMDAMAGFVSDDRAQQLRGVARELNTVLDSEEARGFDSAQLYEALNGSLSVYTEAQGDDLDSGVGAFLSAVDLAGGVANYIFNFSEQDGLDHAQFGLGSAGTATSGLQHYGSQLIDGVDGHQTRFGDPALDRIGRLGRGVGYAGGALGVLSSLSQLDGDNSGLENLGLGFEATGGTSATLAPLLKQAGMRTAASYATGIGTAFLAGKSALDAYQLVQDGDLDGALIAALPAIGSLGFMGLGAMWGSAGGPFGTLAGAGIGLTIGTVMQLAANWFGIGRPRPEEGYERATEPGWTAMLQHWLPEDSAGRADDLAGELRNTDENQIGVAPVLAHFADSTGRSPREIVQMLDALAQSPNVSLGDIVGNGILDAKISNWEEVSDAQERRRDDPSVVVPELQFDGNSLATVTLWLDNLMRIQAEIDALRANSDMDEGVKDDLIEDLWAELFDARSLDQFADGLRRDDDPRIEGNDNVPVYRTE